MANDTWISKKTLRDWIRPDLRDFWVTNRAKYAGFGDAGYGLPAEGQIWALIGSYSPPGYTGELFDCEDFAFEFKAHVARQVRLEKVPFDSPPAIGIAWGRFSWIGGGERDHACNWVYDNNHEFSWFEPQNQKVHLLTECAGDLVLLLV